MKKLLILMMITLLTVAFIGCSKESSNQKTEEELRADIKAELEAEQKAKDTENDESESLEENEVYNLSSLSKGDNIEGLTIDFSYEDEGVGVKLFGERTVQGKINYIDSEFISGYTISFNEPLLNKPIVIEQPSGEKMEMDFSFMVISNPEKLESLISKEQIEYITAVPFNEHQDGNELKVEVILKDFTFVCFYQSEGFQECEIIDVLSIESN